MSEQTPLSELEGWCARLERELAEALAEHPPQGERVRHLLRELALVRRELSAGRDTR